MDIKCISLVWFQMKGMQGLYTIQTLATPYSGKHLSMKTTSYCDHNLAVCKHVYLFINYKILLAHNQQDVN